MYSKLLESRRYKVVLNTRGISRWSSYLFMNRRERERELDEMRKKKMIDGSIE